MRAGRSFHRFPIAVEREPRLAIVEHAEDIPGRRVEGSSGGISLYVFKEVWKCM